MEHLEEALFAALKPGHVVPMVAFLASEACTVTRHNFSSGAGRYARGYMSLVEGWLADPAAPPATLEDIEMHFAEITSTESSWIPEGMSDEMFQLVPRLGLT